jgi:DNA (cytosine-5)-methyltransferase 1
MPQRTRSSDPTVIDLFCGAGGLSAGLQRAGFFTVAAFDHNKAAVATYSRNLGNHVSAIEIAPELELPRVDVIAGGPPCQGFSSAGMRRTGDERNTLVSVFAHLVARARPLAFLFENVEGFLTGENGNRVLDFLDPLIEAGYRIHLRKINAANYGVPQHRKRVIALGGLGWDPMFPEPTHSAFGAPGASQAAGRQLPLTPSVSTYLADLPTPWPSPPGCPQGHYSSPPTEDDIARFHALKMGQTMRDLPSDLWHPSYRRRAYRRVMDGTPTERRGGAPAGIRRLQAAEPSKAITSFARNEFVHPYEDRFLTLRECARIQTFDDEFEFVGSAADQALLIGNSIPPTLGTTIARSLAAQLPERCGRANHGALLSFVPTASSGMSPALERIADRVATAYRPMTTQLELWG